MDRYIEEQRRRGDFLKNLGNHLRQLVVARVPGTHRTPETYCCAATSARRRNDGTQRAPLYGRGDCAGYHYRHVRRPHCSFCASSWPVRYLAAKGEADHYNRERQREEDEILTVPDIEAHEVGEILSKFGLRPHEYNPVVEALRDRPEDWLEFMMRFELGLEKPNPKRALQSAITIAASYVIGGVIPLTPYMLLHKARTALEVSIAVTLIALLLFGYFKGLLTGTKPFLSAFQTTFIGALASAAAFGIALAIQS
ncbi:hypothetical protein KP509_03G063500 [Ceratopteris richardii]|uniref:Uncharacterized protein n=1 Tax=Ceratopteris richardii TaxID=49495 RepID=A0A8T2V0G8_CERRI|nr:hypothetical protein KP509_03G063500 [Ceratopteris richardii]